MLPTGVQNRKIGLCKNSKKCI